MLALLLQSLPFFGFFSYGQQGINDSTSTFGQQDVTGNDTIGSTLISKVPTDTLKKTDTVSTATSDIETTIVYSADDSIQMDVVNKMVYLYGNAKIKYGDISLEAAKIDINYGTNVMSAYPVLDSAGHTVGKPLFKEKSDIYIADTIRYNAKSKKGLIKGVVTKQGEGILIGEKVKKVDENLYISSAHYTTCNLSHPHFYIHARKLKVIPKDKIVSGPFNLVVADVPAPLGFFLGYFPMPKKKKSGFIIPTFGSNATRGFFLRQGGYYWAVNDYLGVQAVGDIYANNSYRASFIGNYNKRYAYRGNVSFSQSRVKDGFDETSGFSQNINFTWNHSTIAKKNSNLTANVNILSAGYFKQNSYNPTMLQQGSFSSNVNYYKAFANTPFNLNVALRQDQNIKTRVMNFVLPEVTFNMNRVYPFKNSTMGKKGVGNSMLNNFFVQYSSNAKLFLTNDSTRTNLDTTLAFNGKNLPKLFSKAQYGAKHTIPIGTTLKFQKTFLRFFNINPSATFEQWFYPYTLDNFQLDPKTNKVFADTIHKFVTTFDYFLGLSANTTIYGMYKFKSKKLLGIRHTINPIVAYNFRPSFNSYLNYQSNVQLDTLGTRGNINKFQNQLYGGPSGPAANVIAVTINNTVEGKMTSKKDTVTGVKKFKIIDQFTINGNYNFNADSFNLSVINLSARTRVLNRLDIQATALYDPYAYRTEIGTDGTQLKVREKKYAITQGQGLATLMSYNVTIGASLNPVARKKQYQSAAGSSSELAQINLHPEMYVDFNIPWNLRFNYTVSVSNTLRPVGKQVIQSMMFNGDLKLSEKWKIVFNSGFDIVAARLTTTRIDIYRDLHCWQMSLGTVPFGPQKMFGFTISAKSSILQDLKLNKRSTSYYGTYLY